MPYISQIHVNQCRNVRDLDIDLSLPGPDALAPVPSSPPRAFRHLILTGPNGSGKSGILEGVHEALIKALFPGAEASQLLRQNRKRRKHLATPSAVHADDPRINSIQGRLLLDLRWDVETSSVREAFAQNELITVYLPSKRHVDRQDVRGPRALEGMQASYPRRDVANNLLQFLVNNQADRAFALAHFGKATDEETAERLGRWFARFWEHIRWLKDDRALHVEFNQRAYDVRFHRGDGYVFDLNTLADGHNAALSILAELLLRVDAVQQARDDYTFEPSGIVVIDEIETHLHLALQEQILTFLTELFPRLQFLVATHSPAVIVSIPGAIVCDLGTREQTLSDQHRGIPYGILMKEHFKISSDIDLDSTGKLLRLRELAGARARSADEERELRALAAELSQRSPVLAAEVWMVMKGIGASSVQVGEARS